MKEVEKGNIFGRKISIMKGDGKMGNKIEKEFILKKELK